MNGRIRVMTYNVRALKDDNDALRRVITACDPDVLCVQEIYRHPFSDHRVAKFAGSVGLVWSGGKRGRMSTTLFTSPRIDVHSAGHGLYTVPRPQEPRGFGWAVVSRPGEDKVCVISTHLTTHGEQRPGEVHELLADKQLPQGMGWVIAGDLNEHPEDPVAGILKDSGFKDAGPHTFTSPADKPVQRIDFVYASAQLTTSVPNIELQEHDLMRASDHRPVIVDIEL